MADRASTIESVSGGLIKLVREVNGLKSEVQKLKELLSKFTEKHPVKWAYKSLPPEAGATSWRARYETDEPRSKIEETRFNYLQDPHLEIPTKTLLVISKEIDGALRDIRATRVVLTDISDDSDLRRVFLNWKNTER